jgi:hypothetical protein
VQKCRLANQQITPDGDGKMMRHITGCVTTHLCEQYGQLIVVYADCVDHCWSNIHSCCILQACIAIQRRKLPRVPQLKFTIHASARISKDKEKDKQEKQRVGQAPRKKWVATKLTNGLEDTDIVITTSSSGLQIQESFTNYSKHLVQSLPDDHNATILMMDGHQSQWTVNNWVFPYFLPSHTSMWLQPNDCNMNQRIHECKEKSAQKYHQINRAPSLTEYNAIIKEGWQLFIDEEDMKVNSSSHKGGGVLNPDNNCTKAGHPVLTILQEKHPELQEPPTGGGTKPVRLSLTPQSQLLCW